VPFVSTNGSYVFVWRPCQEGTRGDWTSEMSSQILDLRHQQPLVLIDAVGVRVQESSVALGAQSLLWLTRLEWEELVLRLRPRDQVARKLHDPRLQSKPLMQKHRMVTVGFGLHWLAEVESQCQLRTTVLMNLVSYERMLGSLGETGVVEDEDSLE